MSIYKHGIRTNRKPTALTTPLKCASNVQVIVGTAPVNLLDDPESAVNVPLVAYSNPDAVAKVGYSDNFADYTICQSIYASFNVFAVAPIIMINVLDPNRAEHKTAVIATQYAVENGKALVNEKGILLSTVEVTSIDATPVEYEEDDDYVLSFADDGTLIITIVPDGAASGATAVKAAYTKLKPSGVTANDIIGGYNVATRVKTGLEVIADIYPKTGIVPGTIIAPGFSHNPNVNSAMTAKCELISSLFSCKCISDIDSTASGAESLDEVRTWKNTNSYSDRRTFGVWPMVKVGTYQYYFSAQLAALLQYLAANNGDIPSESCDNKALKITGLCLADGTEITFDMDEANDYCNACGIITAINVDGWKCWGSNTTVYPSSTDIIDRWVTSIMMFDYVENNFKRTFFNKVGNRGNYREIENVVASENIILNGMGSDNLAGGEIGFSADENPITEIMGGHIKFHERIAFYAPMEDIENEFEFDPTLYAAALEGGN